MSEQHKRFCQYQDTCGGESTCGGPIMTLQAKAIVKNKCWIVENNGKKIATILANPKGVVWVDQEDQHREQFASLRLLSDKYNVIVDKTAPKKVINSTHNVYGFPCDYNATNILWDVPKKLPVFTKGNKSKSFFCAGYYIVKFNNGWVKSYCPKLITLNRYSYAGPYETLEEMQEHLRIANGALHGTSIKSAPEDF
jgi:hypothetical protein